ncbi:MAG: alpha-amylase/4-alpha-glucanotransferase domain-containing protein [Elusimicrobiota bacterium]
MKILNFLFGSHCHQPVGNFGYIYEEAYQKAYLPFIKVLTDHPRVKLSLHYSGPLLLWIEDKHPEFIEQLKQLLALGQIEILSGGFYEPILPVLPDVDKRGQIRKMNDWLTERFGLPTKGIWLAERVWEPHLARILVEEGREYTFVDDAHFLTSGFREEDLCGYFLSEEQGYAIKIFPINKKLRYLIPFAPIEQIIENLRNQASEDGETAAIIFDDGEKFGYWPQTDKLVYEEKWLDKFFLALEENKEWLITSTISDFIKKHSSRGRAYLPSTSYSEMNEWSLPSAAGEELEEIFEQIKNIPQGEKIKRFLRGGFWRNFLTKYPESNNLHKRMLGCSKKVHSVLGDKSPSAGSREEDIFSALWASQCNCAYWHGVFGGLYLPHLRQAVYSKFIQAENLLTEHFVNDQEKVETNVVDFDCDGQKEIVVSSPHYNFYFSPAAGGSLTELDLKKKQLNLINTISRRYEMYHKKLRNFQFQSADVEGKSPHEQVISKEEGLDRYLQYDWYRRTCLLDHFFHSSTNKESFYGCRYGEQGDFVNQPYAYQLFSDDGNCRIVLTRQGGVWVDDHRLPVEIEKQIFLSKSPEIKIDYRITNKGNVNMPLWLGTEFNFSFSSVKGLKTMPESYDDVGLDKFAIKDEIYNLECLFTFQPAAKIWLFPLETVSISEGGFEKCYQQTIVVPQWKQDLPPGNSFQTQIKIEVV